MDIRPGRVLPWLPTYAAVVLLLGLLVYALVSLRPDPPRRGALPAPVDPPPFLAGPAPPSPSPSQRPTPRRAVATPPPETTVTTPPPGVAGRYRVVDTFRDSFIGEVRVSNSAARPRAWTVRLRFSATDTLRTFWVEGAPRPTLARSGDTFTFTGAAPVTAGDPAPLRFHFDRDGPVPSLTECSVNGTACTLTTAP